MTSSAEPHARPGLALAGLAVLITTVSLGLSISGVLPATTPGYVGVLLSSLVMALGAAAVVVEHDHLSASAASKSLAGLGAVTGPFLTACALSAGGWLPLVWGTVLMLGGLAGVMVWVISPPETGRKGLSAPPIDRPVAASHPPAVVPTAESVANSVNTPAVTRLHRAEESPAADPSLAGSPDLPSDSSTGVTQRITRRIIDGVERMEVEWCVEFAAGQLVQSLHLPISPPLCGRPEVECEPLDGEDVELSIGTVMPYGVRVEARRSSPGASAAQVTIGLLLTARRTPVAA